MEAYGGVEIQLHHSWPLHQVNVSAKLHAPADLPRGIGDWVGPRSDLDAVKTEISRPSRVSNTGPPERNPSLYRLQQWFWSRPLELRITGCVLQVGRCKRATVNSASSSLPQCTFPLLISRISPHVSPHAGRRPDLKTWPIHTHGTQYTKQVGAGSCNLQIQLSPGTWAGWRKGN
jgi:hypothetical protein